MRTPFLQFKTAKEQRETRSLKRSRKLRVERENTGGAKGKKGTSKENGKEGGGYMRVANEE